MACATVNENSNVIKEIHSNNGLSDDISVEITTHVHSSNPSDRTLLMWDPKLRWIPEHSMHMSTPRFKLAHSGVGASQSTQEPLPGTRFFIVCIEARSFEVSGLDFDEILACNDLNISCSMTATHSSRSSELAASKCHCLPSSDTI